VLVVLQQQRVGRAEAEGLREGACGVPADTPHGVMAHCMVLGHTAQLSFSAFRGACGVLVVCRGVAGTVH